MTAPMFSGGYPEKATLGFQGFVQHLWLAILLANRLLVEVRRAALRGLV